MAAAAKRPSAGFPMARDRAMVRGTTGSTRSPPRATRSTMGEQPAAWAPKIRGRGPSASPAFASSAKPLSILVRSEPPAMGAMTAPGSRQPSCSTIS